MGYGPGLLWVVGPSIVRFMIQGSVEPAGNVGEPLRFTVVDLCAGAAQPGLSPPPPTLPLPKPALTGAPPRPWQPKAQVSSPSGLFGVAARAPASEASMKAWAGTAPVSRGGNINPVRSDLRLPMSAGLADCASVGV